MVDFLFVITELFHCLLRLRRYQWKSVNVSIFRREVGHFEHKFQTEGALPTNRCWCQNTTVIDLLRGIKISAVYYLVLSQITRVIDRHTDLLQLYCTGMHCMHRAVKITKNHELSMFG